MVFRRLWNCSKEWPEAKILVLTSYLDNEKIYPVIEAGAKGYMLKTSSAAEILNSIRKVYRGEEAIETVGRRSRHRISMIATRTYTMT